MLGALMGAMASLLGVGLGGFINFKVAKLNVGEQRRQRAEELRLEKLEELYFLFDKWQINFSNVYLSHLRCYNGRMSFAEVVQFTNERANTLLAPGEAQKYKMLLDVHFPALEQAHARVEDARANIVPFLADPSVSRLSAQAFVAAQKTFEAACDEFKSRAASLGHVGRW
jgi:hypothetical protein